MIRNVLSLRIIVALLLILVSGSVFAFAFAADALGFGNNPGLGPRQIVVTWVGCALLAVGVFLLSGAGRRLFQGLVSLSAGSEKSASVLAIASWFGLITGLVQVFIFAYRKYSGEYIGLSLHVVWMAVVTTLVTFLIPGAVLLVIGMRSRQFDELRTGNVIFGFLSFVSVFVMFPKIHVYAAILLSLGLGTVTGRLVDRNPSRFYWLVQNSLPGFAAIPMTLALWMIVLNP